MRAAKTTEGSPAIVKRSINIVWFCIKWGLVLALLALAVTVPYLYRQMREEIRSRVEARFAELYPDLTVTIRAAELVQGEGIRIRGLSLADPKAGDPHNSVIYSAEEAVLRLAEDRGADSVSESERAADGGHLSRDCAQQRRLAGSVGTDDGDAIATFEQELRHAHERAIESDLHPLRGKHPPAPALRDGHLQRDPPSIPDDLDGRLLESRELLLAVLRLAMFLARPVAIDELAVLLRLRLLAVVQLLLPRSIRAS